MWYNISHQNANVRSALDMPPHVLTAAKEYLAMADTIILPTRCCTKCNIEKPLTKEYFHYNQQRGRKPRYRVVCIDCVKDARRTTPKKPTAPEGMKHCSRCNSFYPETLEYFRPNKKYTKGLFSWCRQCCRDWDNEWHKEHPDKVQEWKRKYRAKPEYQETRKKYEQSEGYVKSQNRYHAKPEAKAIAKVRIQKRRVLEKALPHTITGSEWQSALDYFNHSCAVCNRPAGLWHTLAMDHWIPITNPNCPGTVVDNCVPLCHGVDGCNNSKYNYDAVEWLNGKFGKRKAKEILNRINNYFESVK